MLQVSGLMSLLPLLAKELPGGGAGTFSALLAATGVGAVGDGGVHGPRCARTLRPRPRRDRWAALLHAASALRRGPRAQRVVRAAVPVRLPAGGDPRPPTRITVSAQLTLPDWVRARGMAVYQMALMGGAAGGAALWGHVAAGSTCAAAVLASAAFGVLAVLLTLPPVDRQASTPTTSGRCRPRRRPSRRFRSTADDGPVMVTMEYQIDPARAAEFARGDAAHAPRAAAPGRAVVGLVPRCAGAGALRRVLRRRIWLEHQRRLERFTAGDAGLRELRLSFHIGEQPPSVRRLVGEPMLE